MYFSCFNRHTAENLVSIAVPFTHLFSSWFLFTACKNLFSRSAEQLLTCNIFHQSNETRRSVCRGEGEQGSIGLVFTRRGLCTRQGLYLGRAGLCLKGWVGEGVHNGQVRLKHWAEWERVGAGLCTTGRGGGTSPFRWCPLPDPASLWTIDTQDWKHNLRVNYLCGR